MPCELLPDFGMKMSSPNAFPKLSNNNVGRPRGVAERSSWHVQAHVEPNSPRLDLKNFLSLSLQGVYSGHGPSGTL